MLIRQSHFLKKNKKEILNKNAINLPKIKQRKEIYFQNEKYIHIKYLL